METPLLCGFQEFHLCALKKLQGNESCRKRESFWRQQRYSQLFCHPLCLGIVIEIWIWEIHKAWTHPTKLQGMVMSPLIIQFCKDFGRNDVIVVPFFLGNKTIEIFRFIFFLFPLFLTRIVTFSAKVWSPGYHASELKQWKSQLRETQREGKPCGGFGFLTCLMWLDSWGPEKGHWMLVRRYLIHDSGWYKLTQCWWMDVAYGGYGL